MADATKLRTAPGGRILRRVCPGFALAALLLPAAPAAAASSAAAWSDVAGKPAAAHNGARPQIRPQRFRALSLDRGALARVLDAAPAEQARAARAATLTLSLPAPGGGFERFAVARSPVMEAGLAAKHPEIATYAGTGIDTAGATVRLDLTPAGFHASVRGPGGSWYIDPYYHRDQSLYVSYRAADLTDSPHGSFAEREPEARPARQATFGFGTRVDGPLVSLRTYRLALASDPGYATYHGAANVTAQKATLVNRVDQIYEDDFGIHLDLVANNDALNLDTAAEMTDPDGPCGAAPCYTAAEAAGCDSPTLDKTRTVIGQLIGASNFDVGHIGMGVNSGGIAALGVVGGDFKAAGCTGVDEPVGDLFAVDYVAHELGHQFDADHTFNGTGGACAGNIGAPAVEPGSAATVMGYAGICGTDDLQAHSDPYFSQRSITEVGGYVGLSLPAVNEVQTVSLRGFGASDSFHLTYNGHQSALITRGVNYDPAGIEAAIEGIPGFPGSVTVFDWTDLASTLDDTGFAVDFSGALAGVDALALGLTDLTGVTGFVGETTQGGPARNGGTVAATANHAPVVDAPPGFTIPARTPFRLTGSATDADGDALTYLWEQNDAGTGASLVSNAKARGPLFRVFGSAAPVTHDDTIQSPSPGENAAGTSPTRDFPDLAQIAAANTNAASGTCPAAGPDPVAPAIVECYSEFLPTGAYVPTTLHFRLTARDGHAVAGGVGHDDTTLTLAKSAGPFRVTSQAAATTLNAGAPTTVTWSVAGTSAAPVSAANVRITMSTDGGETFPKLVIPSTPNDGSQVVFLPNADTTQARLRISGVGNVFFDINRAPFTVTPGAPEVVNDAPATGATAQVAQALPTVTIDATDENTQGSSLTAVATGLPAGLALVEGAPSPGAGTPGTRTWTVAGVLTAAPGTYPVDVAVADGTGRVGETFFDVVVVALPPPPPPPPQPLPPPPPPPPPPPQPAPAVATLAPDLSRVASRLRLSSTGRVKLLLRCRKVGTGTAPARCTGSVGLTAAIGGRKRTIGTATFNFPRSATRTVQVRLTATARRSIRSAKRATLTMTVRNGRLASRKATKAVRILPRR